MNISTTLGSLSGSLLSGLLGGSGSGTGSSGTGSASGTSGGTSSSGAGSTSGSSSGGTGQTSGSSPNGSGSTSGSSSDDTGATPNGPSATPQESTAAGKRSKAVNSSSRAVSVKATVTDLGNVTVIQVEDKDVLKAMNESFAEEPAQQVDEKQLRAEIRSVFRKAMAQLSMPMFVAGSSAKDELSTVMSLLKVLKPTEAREAEHSTRLGAPLDTKL